MTLTSRQLQALRFIAERCAAGSPPSRLEVNEHLGVTSNGGSAARQCRALVAKGLITHELGTARSVRMTEAGWRASGVTSRVMLLEELYVAAEKWEMHGDDRALVLALDALRDFDAAASKQEVA